MGDTVEMQSVAAAPARLRVHGAWRWLRLASLPIILVVLLWQREWVFSQLETWFGLGFAELPIKLYTTIVERGLVAVGCAAGFTALVLGVYATAPPKWRFVCAVLLTAAASVVLGIILALPLWTSFLPALLLALNAMPSATLGRVFDGRVGGAATHVVLGAGLGIAETLLPRPFWIWLIGGRAEKSDKPDSVITALASWAPGILVAAAVFGLGAAYSKLVKVGWILNASDDVQLVYGGENVGLYSEFDVASIPFDLKDRRLYMCGNGLPEAMVLSVDTPAQPASNTRMGVARVEFCILDPIDRSFVAYNSEEDTLRVWNLDDWGLRNSIPMHMPPDSHAVFLSKQQGSPVVVAASEIIDVTGRNLNMRAIDIVTGATLGTSPIIAGHMIVDPVRPHAYVDFYTRETGILQLALPSLELLARAPSDERNDRMAIDAKRGRLLVASPLHGRVLVYDTNGLIELPAIASTVGVRAVAVDSSRDLLVTASLVSNYVDVIDLETNQRVKRLRVGPWLRNLALDEICGQAFVASRHGVYWVKYAEPHPGCPIKS